MAPAAVHAAPAGEDSLGGALEEARSILSKAAAAHSEAGALTGSALSHAAAPEALMELVERCSWLPASELKAQLPLPLVKAVVGAGAEALSRDAPVVAVPAPAAGAVTVVGDVHGQLHDVLRIIRETPRPSPESPVVWNGDFVDRGNWGLEVFLVLLAWKAACPDSVFLLRGNHETLYAHDNYGFRAELEAKYGEVVKGEEPTGLWRACLDAMAKLPYAATVAQGSGSGVCVVHGGVFRPPLEPGQREGGAGKGRKRARGGGALPPQRPGTLKELERAFGACDGGGDEPLVMGSERLLSDALWSDPSAEPGLRPNEDRGIGAKFGPDATEAFLSAARCELLVRGHEGPDARMNRMESAEDAGGPPDPLGQPLEEFDGFHVDHRWAATGKPSCVTCFSAPGYPQHEESYHRPACVLRLKGPAFADLDQAGVVVRWTEAAPRPEGEPYYDLDTPGSDIEGPE